MTADQAAATFFHENPSIDSVITTSDGNAFLEADVNLAKFHAEKNSLAAPATKTRAALTAAIATAALEALQREAVVDLNQAVNAANAAAVAAAAAEVSAAELGYEDMLAELAEDLDADALEELDASYTIGDVTLTRDEMVVATWYRGGGTKAEWLALSQGAREALVTAEFESIIDP